MKVAYRVWDYLKEEMVNVETLYLSEGMFAAEGALEHDIYPYNTDYYSDLLPYVGFQDDDGNDIYLGDIVKGIGKYSWEKKEVEVHFMHGIVMAGAIPLDNMIERKIVGNKFSRKNT